MTPHIDARNGCYGNEEATAADGVLEDIHDAPGHSPRVIAGEVAQYDPAPEHKGEIAVRESREPEGAGVTSNVFRDVQTRLDGGERPAQIPKYDGNLLPAMTAMVTGFVDKLTEERAKLFRESTTDLLPEFAHMVKKGTL